MSFIASCNLSSVSFQSQSKVLKNTLKNVKPSQTPALLSQSTVEKEYVVHWGTTRNFLFRYSWHDHAKNSFISSAGRHHAGRFPCKTTGTCKLQPVVSPPLENVSTITMSNARPTCSPGSFSLLCMYNTTTAWLYLYNLKFDIVDATIFTGCLSCTTHWQISTWPTSMQTDFFFSDFNLCVPLH